MPEIYLPYINKSEIRKLFSNARHRSHHAALKDTCGSKSAWKMAR